ncbi:hypothetical protein MVLG_06448 [Microbotryum lychnidis-dioicae p1A1 Lamole]|uniref:Rab-GAP TBC domain-containing protein n=1 Tax=Microbotryum lychnidis-dioicae (strain p1A1 Lamole / MvSl-1064) TaxID=683840 RepID=U5HHB2_USTV1|nr:hypothetical protein MVLG_06448 [Microbotryum lychnidis-dioicae p1A1 Lamole]|eukprot:KDE03059.1 hypothetical protein MVLG_06448 [Microbotryum lychnidis-dioicae p1A1 Lamole]
MADLADDMSFDITAALDQVHSRVQARDDDDDDDRSAGAAVHSGDAGALSHVTNAQLPQLDSGIRGAAEPDHAAPAYSEQPDHHQDDQEDADEPASPPDEGDLSRPSWAQERSQSLTGHRVDEEGGDELRGITLAAESHSKSIPHHDNDGDGNDDMTFQTIRLDQYTLASPTPAADGPSEIPSVSGARLTMSPPLAPLAAPPSATPSPTLSASADSSFAPETTTTAATSKQDLDDEEEEVQDETNAESQAEAARDDSPKASSTPADGDATPVDADGTPSNLVAKRKASLSGRPIAVAFDGQPAGTSTPPVAIATSPTKAKRLGTRVPTEIQKIMSMTRQRDLPPKDKLEEERHLKQLEEMRAAAKEAERRRQFQLQAAAMARATRIAAAHSVWENQVLPNWRAVTHESAEGRELRKLWWDGTMPVRWRGRLWSLCIGNGLAVSRTSFAGILSQARRGLNDGTFFKETMAALEEDVQGTLRNLKLFQRGGAMHEDLINLLLGYVVYASKATGQKPCYPPGLACPAAMLLINMSVADAFISLVNLVNKSFLKSFYGDNPDEPDAYYRIFDTLLADNMPKVYENFYKEVVRPSLYLHPWLTSMFVQFLPLDLSTRLFDVFLLEGDAFVFRVALVLLQILEPRLFNPVQSELDEVFRGKDRGAIAVVRRERIGSILLGGGGETEEEVRDVLVEEVYTEMGCTEDRVFELLGQQDWKEETWHRLVERELPEAD